MITRTASRRIRRQKMGASGMAARRNEQKARHLAKLARRIELAQQMGRPLHGEKGRFMSAKAMWARVSNLLRFRHQPEAATA